MTIFLKIFASIMIYTILIKIFMKLVVKNAQL